MRFVDQVRIVVRAGRGGDGAVAWRREKYVPKGGPAGGDGGRGGSVVFQADPQLTTLLDLHYRRVLKAPDGQPGGKRDCNGRAGEDLIIKVPVGTSVYVEGLADEPDSHFIVEDDDGVETVYVGGNAEAVQRLAEARVEIQGGAKPTASTPGPAAAGGEIVVDPGVGEEAVEAEIRSARSLGAEQAGEPTEQVESAAASASEEGVESAAASVSEEGVEPADASASEDGVEPAEAVGGEQEIPSEDGAASEDGVEAAEAIPADEEIESDEEIELDEDGLQLMRQADEALTAPAGQLLGDLTDAEQQLVIAQGGQGGRGNIHFRSSTNRAPDRAEDGRAGEAWRVRLELKLLADVGIVGFPNVGKSTLIRKISRARPKVGAYPFTTLIPNLGVVQLSGGRSMVVADVPGLIRGASDGKGLGHQFLRHLERTRVLLHVLAPDYEPGREPVADLDALEQELDRYGSQFDGRPRVVALNKRDILGDETGRALVAETRVRLRERNIPLFLISAETGAGIPKLLEALWRRLAAQTP